MEATGTTANIVTPQKSTKQQLCPECGAIMIEEDRLRENGLLFIWYTCSKDDCEGKWLSWRELMT